MARHLYRLARWSGAHARRVVAAWVALLLALGITAATAAGDTSDEFSIPGTESFQALDRLAEAFPGAQGASAQVVFVAPDGSRLQDPQVERVVARAVADLADGPQVAAAVPPSAQEGTISRDGRTGYATVQFDVAADAVSDASRADAAAAVDAARAAGLQVEVGGDALLEAAEVGHTSEAIGLAVAAVVLVVTLGSLVAAGLPLLTALVGVGVGVGGVLALSSVVDMSSTAPVLALMLGLAVGIDYALFILTRHRAQLADGVPVAESVARATATAGSAVVFAGATVVVALAGLSLMGIPFLTVMGLAAAATVAVAVLIALTLLPASLVLLGDRIGRGRVRRSVPVAGRDRTAGRRWVRAVLRRPVLTAVACLVGLGVVAVPAASLELGLPGNESASTDTTQRRAYDLVSSSFGAGANGPLVVLVEAREDAPRAAAALAEEIGDLSGVAAVSPPTPDASGAAALLQVVPTTGPADEATRDLVTRIRDVAAGAERAGASRDVEVAVTGTTAINIDVTDKLTTALPLFLAVVVGLALVLLLVVFRSVAIPLQAVAGFLLSLAATAGAVVAVFQWGWGASLLGVDQVGPILSFLPVLLVGILFGLAMDYQVFLVSRMREEHVHGAPDREAIEVGYVQGARVVAAAALIMMSVFFGFFLADDPVIKSVGFALALGVALDAFVVRMTLLPAVMAVMGRRTWSLPRGLRWLPRVDVEGTSLQLDGPSDGRPQPAPESPSVPAGSR
jgi:RND superfamily putative drug exporter